MGSAIHRPAPDPTALRGLRFAPDLTGRFTCFITLEEQSWYLGLPEEREGNGGMDVALLELQMAFHSLPIPHSRSPLTGQWVFTCQPIPPGARGPAPLLKPFPAYSGYGRTSRLKSNRPLSCFTYFNGCSFLLVTSGIMYVNGVLNDG